MSGPMIILNGEWMLPNHKTISVTIKELHRKKDSALFHQHSSEMMDLGDLWARIDCYAIARLYGVVLGSPSRCLVFEDMHLGAFDVFLRDSIFSKSTTHAQLVNAARSLSIAVRYLTEHEIVHTRIRCSTLQVKNFEPGCRLDVKLGDPGFCRPYTNDDKPYIPNEYLNDLEKAKTDIKADHFAYATTLYEIFDRGQTVILSPQQLNDRKNGKVPVPPGVTLEIANITFPSNDVYDIILEGWDKDPEKRFNFQTILARLNFVHDKVSSTYQDTSIMSNETEKTYVKNYSSYVQPNGHSHSDSDGASTSSSHSFTQNQDLDLSQEFLVNGNGHHHAMVESSTNSSSSMQHHHQHQQNGNHSRDLVDISESNVRHLKNRKIKTHNGQINYVFNELLGKGNFGDVYEGDMQDLIRNDVKKVAMKVISVTGNATDRSDLIREADIMKNLEHENIVKVLDVINQQTFVVVMELIPNGQLLIYLQSMKSNLSLRVLLKFAEDIANVSSFCFSLSFLFEILSFERKSSLKMPIKIISSFFTYVL